MRIPPRKNAKGGRQCSAPYDTSSIIILQSASRTLSISKAIPVRKRKGVLRLEQQTKLRIGDEILGWKERGV